MRIVYKLYIYIVEFLNKSLFNVPNAFSNIIIMFGLLLYYIYFFLVVYIIPKHFSLLSTNIIHKYIILILFYKYFECEP